MSNGEKQELKILAGILLVSLLFGALTANSLLFLLLGVLTYLIWHLYQLLRLIGLIRQHQRISFPYPPGLWGEIHRALEKSQSRGQKRKKALVRFASRFRKVAAAMPEGMILLDRRQRIDWANPAACSLLNICFPSDEGKDLLSLLRYPFLQEYLSAADFEKHLEFPSPNNTGQIISLRAIPFGERKRHRLLVVRDVTEVFNLNQVRKDFVVNVSHELRTPLTVIKGFVENLIQARKLPMQEGPLLRMKEQSGRMESIIEGLLLLSQLEVELEHIRKPVKVSDLLQKLVEDARNLSGTQNHRFVTEVDRNLGLVGNETELLSAFSNLIFNAVKYTPPRAEIRISWKFEEQRARFIVRDTGEGIAARHIPRLTERFYRVDQGRSRQSGGTGLGLAIVKHAVSRLGGELDIQSKVGMGSTFQCIFPTGMFCLLPVVDSGQPEHF